MPAEAREKRRSLPFLTADDAAEMIVEVEPPAFLRGSTIDASEVPREEDLELQIEGIVDWRMLRENTGCDDPLDVAVILRCHETRWCEATELATGVTESAPTAPGLRTLLTIDRGCVASTVEVELVVTRQGSDSEAPFNVDLADGAKQVLARQSRKIRFERGGFEFPTRWMDWRRYPDDSLWVVHIAPDSWTLPVEDSVEVRLNREATEFFRILESGRREHLLPARILRSQIALDALYLIFTEYLLGDGIEEDVDPDGSRLCDVVARSIGRIFDRTPGRLEEMAREEPAAFHYRLQHGMGYRGIFKLG